MKTILPALIFALTLNCSCQSDRKLAPTPPMGWNSWNWFGKQDINEVNMKQCMEAIVSEGLLDAGYEYFVIDGGWRDTTLGPNGELLANPVKFPHGIKPLADYAHSLGLKFGLHTVPGTHDCGGDQVGGLGHEEVQVQQFVDWGLDFIKLDKCRNKNPGGWNEDLLEETYVKWRKLLDKSGRDIVLSISAYTWRDWYPEVGQMARTTGDIMTISNNKEGTLFDPPADYKKKHNSVMEIVEKNNKSAEFAGNGYWNDPDMLTTGKHGLTLDEQKAQFALWCIMSSPLMLGNDPRNMTSEEKDIITNDIAISINQDNTEQGKRIKVDGKTEVWAKKLKGGNLAILLLNRDSEKSDIIEISKMELGLNKEFKMIDVYAKKDLGKAGTSISQKVKPHSGKFLLIKHKK